MYIEGEYNVYLQFLRQHEFNIVKVIINASSYAQTHLHVVAESVYTACCFLPGSEYILVFFETFAVSRLSREGISIDILICVQLTNVTRSIGHIAN